MTAEIPAYALRHILHLLHPKLHYMLTLQSKADLVEAVREMVATDGGTDTSYLHPEFQDILTNADRCGQRDTPPPLRRSPAPALAATRCRIEPMPMQVPAAAEASRAPDGDLPGCGDRCFRGCLPVSWRGRDSTDPKARRAAADVSYCARRCVCVPRQRRSVNSVMHALLQCGSIQVAIGFLRLNSRIEQAGHRK